MLALVIVGVAVLLAISMVATGANYVVDDDSGTWRDYATVGEAITAASDGDTIDVYEGTYNEDLAIAEELTFTGNGTGTIINGDHDITSGSVYFSMINFTNTSPTDYTIVVDASGGNIDVLEWEDCYFVLGGYAGIHLGGDTGTTNTISNVLISNTEFWGPASKAANPFKTGGTFATPGLGVAIDDLDFVENSVVRCSIPILLEDNNVNDVLMDDNTFTGTDGIIYIYGDSSPTGVLSNFVFTNNEIDDTNSYGVAVGYPNGTFSASNLGTGNMVNMNNIDVAGAYGIGGLSNFMGGTLDGSSNWWGATDGPSGYGSGSGTPITDGVMYNPYYTEMVGNVTNTLVIDFTKSRTVNGFTGTIDSISIPTGQTGTIMNSDITLAGGLDIDGTLIISDSTIRVGDTIYVDGMWVFEDSKNTLYAQDIVINATTYWNNSNIVMDCVNDGDYAINVTSTGSLYVNDDTVITANLTNREYNFWVWDGATFEVRDSTISEVGYVGGENPYNLSVYIEADDVVLINNTFENNWWGPVFASGADDGVIYHNRLFGEQFDALDYGSNNDWDYNNWSTYAGSDSDGDHIGDSAFAIGGLSLSTDDHPLMDPIHSWIWVNGSFGSEGPVWYDTINEGYRAVLPGMGIYVYNGTYDEQLTITKDGITLQGRSTTDTIIQPTAAVVAGTYDIEIDVSNVTIFGFLLDFNGATDSRQGNAIVVSDFGGPVARNVMIRDNVIYSGDTSQAIQTGKDADIGGLVIRDNIIYCDWDNLGEGVYINPWNGTGNVTIYMNEIYGYLFSGISIEASNVNAAFNTIDSNTTAGFYGIRVIDLYASPTTKTGIIIDNNTISNCGDGIRLGTTTDEDSDMTVTITSNDIQDCDDGIDVRYGINANSVANWNSIYNNNNYNVNSMGITVLDADFNYWGATDEPTIAATFSDMNDLDYSPWYDATFTTLYYADTADPVTTLTVGTPSTGAGPYYVTDATDLNLSATDGNGTGVDEIYYRIWYNADPWSGWLTYSGDFQLSGECTHHVEFYAEDNIGNTEMVQNETFYVDLTAPTTTETIGSPSSGTWITSSTSISYAATDAGCNGGVGLDEIYYNHWYGGTWDGYVTYSGAITLAGEGTHHILVYADDLLANSETPTNYTYTLDDTAPVTTNTVGTPNSGMYVTSATTFTLGATDTGGVGVATTEYRVYNGATWTGWTTYAAPFTLPGIDGTYFIEFNSTDLVANAESTNNETYIVDDTDPVSVKYVGTPRNGTMGMWVNQSTVFNFTANDTGAGIDEIYYRIWTGGDPWGSWNTYSGNWTFGEDCFHIIEWYAEDLVGNVEATQNQTHYVDSEGPWSYIWVGEPSFRFNVTTSTVFNLTAFDNGCNFGVGGEMIMYRLWHNGSWGSGWMTYSGNFSLSEWGMYIIEWYSYDELGNIDWVFDYNNQTYYVDDSAPGTTIALGTPNYYDGADYWVNDTTTIGFTIDDGTGVGLNATWYRIWYGSDPWSSWTNHTAAGDFMLGLGDGMYHIEFFSTDLIGNNESSTNFTVYVDSVAPSISISDITEQRYDFGNGTRVPSIYLYTPGTATVYYGDDMTAEQLFYINGTASDANSGFQEVTYSTLLGDTPATDTSSPWSATYGAEATDADGTITITAYDNLDQMTQVTVTVTQDTTDPTITDGDWSESSTFLWVDLTNDTTDNSIAYNTNGMTGTYIGTLALDINDDVQLDRGQYSVAVGWIGAPWQFFSGVSTTTNVQYQFNSGDTWNATISVFIYDKVNNYQGQTGVYAIYRDTFDPRVRVTSISESSIYLHSPDTSTLVFGDGMGSEQSFTINGVASDPFSGLANVSFSSYAGDSPSDTAVSPWAAVYGVDNADVAGVINITAYDNMGNTKMINVTTIRDTDAPSISSVLITDLTLGSTTYVADGDDIQVTATITDANQAYMTTSDITADLWMFGGGNGVNPDWYNPTTGEAHWNLSSVTCSVSDGLNTVWVNATDIVAHTATMGSDDITADNSNPIIAVTSITEWPGSAYLYSPDLANIYFGDDMGSEQDFWINGTVSDGGSGIKAITFSSLLGESPANQTSTPWAVMYGAESTDVGGTITITVIDNTDNTAQVTVTVTQDATNPSFDDGDWSDASSNLYVDLTDDTSDNMIYYSQLMAGTDSGTLTFAVSDNVELYELVYDTGVGDDGDDLLSGASATPTVVYGFDSADTFSSTLTMVLTDAVGNSVTDSTTWEIVLDTTAPATAITAITETSPYLWAPDLATLYFGDDMASAQSFDIDGTAVDASSGLDTVTYSTLLGDSPGADTTSPWSATYDATFTDTGGTISITATDMVGNNVVLSVTVTQDTTAPSIDDGDWSESSLYLWVNTTDDTTDNTIYYGDDMTGTEIGTLTLDLSDAIGLQNITYMWGVGHDGNETLTGTSDTISVDYDFESTDTWTGTLTITSWDMVDNVVTDVLTWDIMRDVTAPVVSNVVILDLNYTNPNWTADDRSVQVTATVTGADYMGGGMIQANLTGLGGAVDAAPDNYWFGNNTAIWYVDPTTCDPSNGNVTIDVHAWDYVYNYHMDNDTIRSDNTGPQISSVLITDITDFATDFTSDGHQMLVEVTIVDAFVDQIPVTSITADLTDLGGNVSDNPNTWLPGLGYASWAFSPSLCTPSDGIVTVWVNVTDAANNTADQANDTIRSDNSAPTISSVYIYDQTNGRDDYVKDGDDVQITATITDTWMSFMDTSMIEANLSEIGYGWHVAPDFYNTVTGMTYWNITNVNVTDATSTVTVDARDFIFNFATQQSDDIIGDVTAPTIEMVVITDTTLGLTNYSTDGDDVQITVYVNDTNQADITTSMITADLTGFSLGAAVNPDGYGTGSGMAYWNLTSVSYLAEGTVTVDVDAADPAGNAGTQASGSIIADNTAPTIGSPSITDTTISSTMFVKNGDNAMILAWINDTNMLNITADTTGLDFFGTQWDTPTWRNAVTGKTIWNITGTTCNPSDADITVTWRVYDQAMHLTTVTDTITADNTGPSIAAVYIYDQTLGRDDYAKTGDDIQVTAYVNDTWQAYITASDITADLAGLGGGLFTNPDYYDTVSGLCIWNITPATVTPGIVTVSVDALDDVGNAGAQQTDTIIGDNTAPTIQAVTITDTTLMQTNFTTDGNDIQITAYINDTYQFDITTSMITADLTGFSLGAAVNPDGYGTGSGMAYWNLTAVTCSPSDGTINVDVDAVDPAGNAGTQSSGSIVADNTAVTIEMLEATDTTQSTTLYIVNGENVAVFAYVNETNLMNVTADMTGFGGGMWDAPDFHNTGTGVAWWNITGVSLSPSDGVITVTVTAYDQVYAMTVDTDTIIADNTGPTIEAVTITNNNTGSTQFVTQGINVTVTAFINDTNQVSITTSEITADLTNLGGVLFQNPDMYNTGTGVATWYVNNIATLPFEGLVTITVDAEDFMGSTGIQASGTTTADNGPPSINWTAIEDQTLSSMTWTKDGDTMRLNVTVFDGSLSFMTTADIWADLTVWGLAANTTADTFNNVTGDAEWVFSSVASTPADGVVTTWVYCRDIGGNFANATWVNITADNTDPSISGELITDETSSRTDFITDGDDVSVYAMISDLNFLNTTADMTGFGGGMWDTPTFRNAGTGVTWWNISGISATPTDGMIYVNISAYDSVLNLVVVMETIMVDTTAPVIASVLITDTTVPHTTYVKDGDDVQVTATITDMFQSYMDTSLISADLTGFGLGAAVAPDYYDTMTGMTYWNLTSVTCTPSDGTITVAVDADDFNDNSATQMSDDIVADNTPPVITSVLITDTTISSTSWVVDGHDVQVTANILPTDNLTVTADLTELGGGAAVAPSYYDLGTGDAYWNMTSVTCTPSDGVITVTVDAADFVGHTDSDTDTITSDNTAPTLSITVGSPSFGTLPTYVTDATDFTLTAGDTGSGIATTEYYVDATPWNTYVGAFNVLTEGAHTIYYRTTDNAGWVTSGSLDIFVDLTAPSASGAWSETSIYLFVDVSGTLWFGDAMGGSAMFPVLSGTAADAGSGLASVTFSTEFGDTPTNSGTLAAWSTGGYGIDSTDTDTDSPAQVTITDNVGHTTVLDFAYAEDNTAPMIDDGDFVAGGGHLYVDTTDDTSDNTIYYGDDMTGSELGWLITAISDNIGLASMEFQTAVGHDGNHVFPTAPVGFSPWVNYSFENTDTFSGALNLSVTDVVGNNYYDATTWSIIRDTSAPTIWDGDWSESSSDLYVDTTSEFTDNTIMYGSSMTSTEYGTLTFGFEDNVQLAGATYTVAVGNDGDDTFSGTNVTETVVYGFDSTDTFTGFITVTVTDAVGNSLAVGSEWQITRDVTAPTINTGEWAGPDVGIYIDSGLDKMWFGDSMTSALRVWINGTATDTSAVERVEFTTEPNLASSPSTHWINGTGTVDWYGMYTVDQTSSATTEETATVTVYDIVGNYATANFTYQEDTEAPTYSGVMWVEGANPNAFPLPDSDYLFVDGVDTLWFSDEMPGIEYASIYAQVEDNFLIEKAAYSDEPNLADSPSDEFMYTNSTFLVASRYGFSDTSDDGDGEITVTLTDVVGNFVEFTMDYDWDPIAPQIHDMYWAESSSYLYIDGSDTLWFGDGMFPNVDFADMFGNVSDNVMLDYAEYSEEPTIARSPGDGQAPAIDEIFIFSYDREDIWTEYGFDSSSSNGDRHINVTVYDKVGNYAEGALWFERDVSAPVFANETWMEDSSYLWIDGDGDLWFGDDMMMEETGTVYGEITENAELFMIEFSSEGNLASSPTAIMTMGTTYTFMEDYGFDASSTIGDGMVVVTAYDQVNNTNFIVLDYGTDFRAPNLNNTEWEENNAFMHIDGSGTLWFSNAMQVSQIAYIEGEIWDNLAFGMVTFSDETGSFVEHYLPYMEGMTGEDEFDTEYEFNTTAIDTDSPVTVTLADAVNNTATATLTYSLDATAPMANITSMMNYDVLNDTHAAVTQDLAGWYWTISGVGFDAGSGIDTIELSIDGGAAVTATNGGGWATWSYDSLELNNSGWHSIEWTVIDRVGNAQMMTYEVYRPAVNSSGVWMWRLADGGILNLTTIAPYFLWMQVDLVLPTDYIWVAIERFFENPISNDPWNLTNFHFMTIEVDDNDLLVGANLEFYYTQQQLRNNNLTEDDLLGLGFFNETSGEWELYPDTGVHDFVPYRRIPGRTQIHEYQGYLWADMIPHFSLISGLGQSYKVELLGNTTQTADIFDDVNDEGADFWVEYTIVVSNEGTENDDFRLSATGPLGWKLFLDGDRDPQGWDDHETDTTIENLGWGESIEWTLTAHIYDTDLNVDSWPLSGDTAEPGRTYYIDIEVESLTDPGTSYDSMVIDAVIRRPDLGVNLVTSTNPGAWILTNAEIDLYAFVHNYGNWTTSASYDGYIDPWVWDEDESRWLEDVTIEAATTEDIIVVFEYESDATWVPIDYVAVSHEDIGPGDTVVVAAHTFRVPGGFEAGDDVTMRARILYNGDEYRPVDEFDEEIHPNIDEASHEVVGRKQGSTGFMPGVAALTMAAITIAAVVYLYRKREEEL